MATGLKRLTFVVTQEMEPLLAHAKKELFYDRTHSDMIRTLLAAGLNAIEGGAVEEAETDMES